MARELKNLTELKSQLSKPFVIFCGSAISGGVIDAAGDTQSFLPMVKNVLTSFFLIISKKVKTSGYFNDVLSNYSLEMIDGKYKNTNNLKFEDFIWRIEDSLGKSQVNKLLYDLYFCETNQYLPNHIAINKLLNNSLSNLCITTNFDNAIENTNPHLLKFVHDQHTNINNIPFGKTIVKLHGDVETGNYIATNPSLLNAEQLDYYNYLDEIFSNSTVLVAGYSGLGDIDISPHFKFAKNMGAKFIWLVYEKSIPSNFVMDVADYFFYTNLFSSERSSNCLLDLANIDNYFQNFDLNIPDWEKRLSDWIEKNNSPEKVLKIIDSCLDGVVGWAKYHLYTIGYYKEIDIHKFNSFEEEMLYVADRCLKIGTYWSGLQALRKINPQNIKGKKGLHEFFYLKGFCYWRLMKINKSINTLEYFFSSKPPGKVPIEFEIGMRTYLEVVRDKMRFLRNLKKRCDFYQKIDIGKKIIELNKVVRKTNNISSQLLSFLVILDIERMIGKKIPITRYEELLERAISFKDWYVAENIALSILRIDKIKGEKKLGLVLQNTDIGDFWHSKKELNLAKSEKLPSIIKFTKRFLIANASVIWREIGLLLKKVYWKRNFNKYIVVNE